MSGLSEKNKYPMGDLGITIVLIYASVNIGTEERRTRFS